MRQPFRFTQFAFTLLAAGLLALARGDAVAHEGHDHGPPTPAANVAAAPRGEAQSELFELVAVARDGVLRIYLDRFATNEPVADAKVSVETPVGSVEAQPGPEGTYTLTAPWAQAGHHDLLFTVEKEGEADILSLALDIAAPPAAPAPTARSLIADIARADSLGGVFLRMDAAVLTAGLIGLLAGVVLMILFRRRNGHAGAFVLVAAVALAASQARAHEGEDHDAPAPAPAQNGRDLAQRLPEGGVFAPKSAQRILAIRTLLTAPATYRRTVELPGRIIADPDASGFVQAAISGRLSPPPGGFPRLGTRVRKGDVLAYVTPPLQAIDVSDMRQRQGELDQQISIVERRLARYEQLVPGGAVARTQLEDTRLELEGLRERRRSLDAVRREPEPLLAPTDGVIADGTPVAGQIAQSNAVVFHVVEPTRLWVEALSYDSLPNIGEATASANGRALALTYKGSGFAARNQSIPVHFAIQGATTGLRVGQFVTVLAETDEQHSGIAIPRASLVRNASGQDIVYEHVAAERFEPRPVRVEPLDGDRVLVADGLDGGKRVVTQGAELLDQVR